MDSLVRPIEFLYFKTDFPVKETLEAINQNKPNLKVKQTLLPQLNEFL